MKVFFVWLRSGRIVSRRAGDWQRKCRMSCTVDRPPCEREQHGTNSEDHTVSEAKAASAAVIGPEDQRIRNWPNNRRKQK